LASLFTFLLSSCSSTGIDNALGRLAGNKPVQLSTKPIDVIDVEHMHFRMPHFNKKRYAKVGGWLTSVIRDGDTIVVSTRESVYHVEVTYKYLDKFTKQDLYILNDDLPGYKTTVPRDEFNVHFAKKGKEHYATTVWETSEKKYKRRKKVYVLNKYDFDKKSVKMAMVTLSYTAKKGFTFRELEREAKIILDTLYIK